MTRKRANDLHVLGRVPLTTGVAIVIASFVIIHLFIFSVFSSNYMVNAQNNNKITPTNSILSRAPTTNTNFNTTGAFIVLFNLQRIQTQLTLSQEALNKGDRYTAFAHAYIPHSVIFPSIKNLVEQVSDNSTASSTKKLESGLTDIPFMIKSGSTFNSIKNTIAKDKSLVISVSSSIANSIPTADRMPIILQIVVFLLRDAEKSYQLSNASTSIVYGGDVGQNNKGVNKQQQLGQIDYQNAIGLVNTSRSVYGQISESIDNSNNNKNSEIKLSFNQLDYLLRSQSSDQLISKLISSMEKSILGQSLLNVSSSNRMIIPCLVSLINIHNTLQL